MRREREKNYHKQTEKYNVLSITWTFSRHSALIFEFVVEIPANSPKTCIIFGRKKKFVYKVVIHEPRFISFNFWLVFISLLINKPINIGKHTMNLICYNGSIVYAAAIFFSISMPNNSWKWIWDKWNWVDFCNISFDLVTRLLDSAIHTITFSISLCLLHFLHLFPQPFDFVLPKIDDEIKRKTIDEKKKWWTMRKSYGT